MTDARVKCNTTILLFQ